MHDKNGRLIEKGDVVIGTSYAHGYKPEPMKVIGCNESASSCNLSVISFEPRVPPLTLNAHDTLLVIKSDGTVVLPPQEI